MMPRVSFWCVSHGEQLSHVALSLLKAMVAGQLMVVGRRDGGGRLQRPKANAWRDPSHLMACATGWSWGGQLFFRRSAALTPSLTHPKMDRCLTYLLTYYLLPQ